MNRIMTALLLFAPLLALCLMAEADGLVHTLTDSNFDEKISTGTWLVQFHAPWCGHCANLLPVWEEAAEQVGEQVSFGKVDSTVETGLAARMAIRGYPTIKVFTEGSSQPTLNYTGARDLSHIVQLAKLCVRPDVEPVTGVSIQNLGAINSDFLLVIDESEESRTAEELYRSLAKSHKYDADFFYATANDAAEYLPTNHLPALLVAKNGKKLIYDGPMEASAVESWVMSERHSVVMELGSGVLGTVTMREVVSMDKLIVVGIKGKANPDDSKDMAQSMWAVAKRLDSDIVEESLANRFVFLLADGDIYFSPLSKFFVLQRTALPFLAVLNDTAMRHYREPSTLPGRYTPDYVMTFLQNVAAGRVLEGGGKYDSFIEMSKLIWINAKVLAHDSPWVLGLMIGLPMIFFLLALVIPSPTKIQDDEFRRIVEEDKQQREQIEKIIAEEQAKIRAMTGGWGDDDSWAPAGRVQRQMERVKEEEEEGNGEGSAEPKSETDKKMD